MKNGHDEVQPSDNAVRIPLVWGDASHLTTLYANHLSITHAGTEFYLTFGELVPPTILNANDLPAQLAIKPMVRIAVSADAMETLVRVIETNFQRFKERTGGEQ